MKNVNRFINEVIKCIDHCEFTLNPNNAFRCYSRYCGHKKFEDVTIAEFLQSMFAISEGNNLNVRMTIGGVGLQSVDIKGEQWYMMDVDTGEIVILFSACSEIEWENAWARMKYVEVNN